MRNVSITLITMEHQVNEEDKALEKAKEYLSNPKKLKNVIEGTNKKKKSRPAKKIDSRYVYNRFFGRLGEKSPSFKELLCEKLDYCGENFTLAENTFRAIINFLIAATAPIYVLLAELIFLLKRRKLGQYCKC